MDIKRLWLVPLMLVGLALATLFTAFAVPTMAHAQANDISASQQGAQAAFDSDTYAFNAEFWGWGVCVAHADLQKLSNFHSIEGMLLSVIRFSITHSQLSAAAFGLSLDLYVLKNYVDRGRGVCMAWPYYFPSPTPITWPR